MGAVVGALTRTQLSPFKERSLFDEDISIPEPIAERLTDDRCRHASPEVSEGVLRVMGAAELTAAHGERFGKQVRASLNGHTSVEIDLSQTTSIDCAGLGALIAIRNQTRLRNGVVRLLNPTTAVQQLLDLMRAGQIFEIANTAI
jgi:anti-anti-sigma factor